MPKVKVTIKDVNKENDIFYAGNFVKAQDGTVVLVTDEPQGFNDYFTAVLIFKGHKESSQLGNHSTLWNKSMFSQFHGEITITI